MQIPPQQQVVGNLRHFTSAPIQLDQWTNKFRLFRSFTKLLYTPPPAFLHRFWERKSRIVCPKVVTFVRFSHAPSFFFKNLKKIATELCKMAKHHALDFWSSNRYFQYLLPNEKVRGLCVGGDMAIFLFANFTEFREKRPHPPKPIFWGHVFSKKYLLAIFSKAWHFVTKNFTKKKAKSETVPRRLLYIGCCSFSNKVIFAPF